jgi:hypothetical protein
MLEKNCAEAQSKREKGETCLALQYNVIHCDILFLLKIFF